MVSPSFVAGCTADGEWHHLSPPASIGKARGVYDAVVAAGGMVGDKCFAQVAIFEVPRPTSTQGFAAPVTAPVQPAPPAPQTFAVGTPTAKPGKKRDGRAPRHPPEPNPAPEAADETGI